MLSVFSHSRKAVFPFLAFLRTHTVFQENISICSTQSGSRSQNSRLTSFDYLVPHNLTMKKYELYLPLKYNDGTEVEPEKLKQIRERLVAVFGAVTVSPLAAPFQGTWQYGGVEFVDDIIRFEIITEQDFQSNLFFKSFKKELKRTLRQFEILITVQEIETL